MRAFLQIITFFIFSQASSQNFINESYKEQKFSDGKYVDSHKNGQKRVEATIKNSNLDGLYISYFNDGQVFDSARFIGGKIHGVHRKYDQKGNLIVEIIFSHDTLISYHEFWYKDSNLIEERYILVDSLTRMIPKYEKVHSSKKNVFYSPKHTVNLLQSTGYSISYFQNGKIDTKEPLVNNRSEGKGASYYEDGTLAIEFYRSKDKNHGKMTFYERGGKIWKEEMWENGKKKSSVLK